MIPAVQASNFLPARTAAEGTDMAKAWEGNDIIVDYQNTFLPYAGDYYQITKGWAQARTSWWNMLQKVGQGEDVATTVATYVAEANAAAAG